jgi:ABC-type uncharacterized transport system auxiliary subunit
VEVSAKLLDARDQRVVASHVFLHTQAASGTALAVATAFGQALDALAGDIAGWTSSAARPTHARAYALSRIPAPYGLAWRDGGR